MGADFQLHRFEPGQRDVMEAIVQAQNGTLFSPVASIVAIRLMAFRFAVLPALFSEPGDGKPRIFRMALPDALFSPASFAGLISLSVGSAVSAR